MTAPDPSNLTLRPASVDDVEAIATVWHRAWRDGHLGHVPAALERHRQLAHFRKRVPDRLEATTVATLESRVIGFVTVRNDEIEQIFVDAPARGSGAAVALLREGERRIAARFDRAWLAVADGNARARRFYSREGWSDAGALDYAAETSSGSIPVPCRRYEKHLKGAKPTRPVAIGMKSHIGWTAVVALAGPATSAEVVAKKRIDMATTFDEGAVYHKSQELPLARAEALVRSSEEKFERIARDALVELVAELRGAGCEPVASGLVSGDGKTLPPLATIVKSHALVHAAEGELYRRVLLRASEACRIPAIPIRAKGIEARAAGALGIAQAGIPARLAALGKASGRPWTRDQKESALAAWIALAGR